MTTNNRYAPGTRLTTVVCAGLLALSALTTSTGLGASSAQARSLRQGGVLRIGYQKFGSLNILKSKGTLEKALAPLGYTVQWTQFAAGPQLLEALNVGSVDLGTTGEAPPIFAQAAGAPLVYVGAEPANPAAEAILVPKNSPLRTVADLRGKTVVLNKGSNVHYLLVEALARAGVPYTAIHTVYLPPADARAAFERGSADAWVIWDPYFAVEQHATGARVLADGRGLVANRGFYLASRAFTTAHPAVIRATLRQIQAVDTWAKANVTAAVRFLAPQIGIDPPSLMVTLERQSFGVVTVDDHIIAQQQQIADAFFHLHLIPKQIRVKDAEWTAASS